MINRATLFFLLVFTLITYGGCVAGQMEIVNRSTLSPEEGEKVKAVRLVEAEELDKISYKTIKKIKGLSCEVVHLKIERTRAKHVIAKNASREDAEEQLKIHAIRAGGNAISNIVCVAESDFMTRNRRCIRHIACSADAIQIP